MELKKLAEADMQGSTFKKIYCYERSASHLTGLCNTYGIGNQIFRIIDDSIRQQGAFSLNGREIPVIGSGDLVQEDFSDSMVIITSDYHRETYEKLCQVPSICKTLDRIYYFADQETEIEAAYREQYKDQDLENIILFRSGPHRSSYVHGMDFSDNARALFEYMLCHNYNKKYCLVWMVKNPDEFLAYQRMENVEFFSFDQCLQTLLCQFCNAFVIDGFQMLFRGILHKDVKKVSIGVCVNKVAIVFNPADCTVFSDNAVFYIVQISVT